MGSVQKSLTKCFDSVGSFSVADNHKGPAPMPSVMNEVDKGTKNHERLRKESHFQT